MKEAAIKSLMAIAILLTATSGETNKNNPTNNSISCESFCDIVINDDTTIFDNSTVCITIAGNTSDVAIDLESEDTPKSQIGEVVVQLYNGSATNTEPILNLYFTAMCSVYGTSVQEIVKQLQDNDQLLTSEVLYLMNNIQRFGCASTEKVKETIRLLKPHVLQTKEKLVHDIRNGTFEHIYNYAKSNSSDRIVSELAAKAFNGTLETLKPTLRFLGSWDNLKDVAIGYKNIAQELKTSGQNCTEELQLLGYWLHHTMTKYESEREADLELKTSFNQIKGELPSLLGDIYWKSYCYLKNTYANEYLYGDDEQEDEGNRHFNGRAFTWLSVRKARDAQWIFEPDIMDDQLYFKIKNRYFNADNHYLCLEGPYWGHVATCNARPNSKLHMWILRHESTSGEHNVIRLENGKQLYRDRFTRLTTFSSQVEHKRRRVWNSYYVDASSDWEISCV